MLFNIKDLDEPLHVSEPVMCKLCAFSDGDNRHCQYCKTMRNAVKALDEHKIHTLALKGIKHEKRIDNVLPIINSKPYREDRASFGGR